MNLSRDDFGDDFLWGVSTSAYQIEGGYNKDGKGLSIWDVFANRKGKVFLNQNANNTCDFYNRYQEDIALLNLMNISQFRFSLSWSRIFPSGLGQVNYHGVDYYNKVIDCCLKFGIEPWITLYHWDLPAELEKKGGWTNREIVDWFCEYVQFCVTTFGDRVKNWIIINEPLVFTGAGYFLGIHAPGRTGLNGFLAAAHHAALCQAEGGRVARSVKSGLNIGTTFSCSLIHPATNSSADKSAARRVDVLLNRMFIEPLIGYGYPVADLPLLRRLEPFIKDGDESRLSFETDFIGIQNYTREVVYNSILNPYLNARLLKADKRKVERTEMNWEVYPESIYHMLKQFGSYKGVSKIIVTENGAAIPDLLQQNEVDDPQRKNYLQKYISQVLRAKREGVNVQGYFIWSFTDNFEWAEGYRPRFGLVYVDFFTQQRYIKSSGNWYKNFLQK
jgi:beta-glucosidase